MSRFWVISSILVMGLVLSILFPSVNPSSAAAVAQNKKQVVITAMLDDLGNVIKWDDLLRPAVQELKFRHPDLDIQINYTTTPYNQTRSHLLNSLENNSAIDLVSVDQIWLGDFAQRGYLANLTDYVKIWGRSSDWYQTNFDGGVYKGRVYGIWAWTDVRGMWYWKDLLNKAGVDPNSLKSWDGYIASARKINSILGPDGISGAALVGLNYSPDLWYPYLWMLGGDIIVMKSGHPVKGSYWFPAYNSSAGVKALEFIKEQVNSGIKPLKSNPDKLFVDRKLAVLQSGSWVPGAFPRQFWPTFDQKIGFIPMFPVPKGVNQTSTMMGGWELAIPQTSKNKELTWELITLMVNPRLMSPWLKQTGFLPTQKSIGSGPELTQLNQAIPYYGDMVSMIPIGKSRPVASEYPQIAEHVRHAIEEVYYGIKQPKQALDDAAKESARALGW
ncbi:MAG: extracellular solute-binding protein [Nitrososphaeraceae archaeon]